MKITVDKQPSCIAKVGVEIPADKVQTERDQLMGVFTKQANIKGFRKGKAPKSMILKHYGKDIQSELTGRLVNAACEQAIKENELEVISVRLLEDPTFTEAGEMKFDAELVLVPTFDLPNYEGLEIEAEKLEVTEESVTGALDDLRQRFAQFKTVEDAETSDGHFVVIDFTTTLDGKTVEEVIGKSGGFLDGREGHWVKIEDDGFLPGLSAAVKGMKVGENKKATITMPEEFPLSDVRGADIDFDITVKEIKEQELPELNDEFAAQLMPGKTVADLEEFLKEQMKNEMTQKIEDSKVNQIVEKLNEQVTIELPESLLEQEIAGTAQGMIDRARYQGMNDEMIAEQQNDIQEAAKKQAKLNLTTNFILQKIAEKEEIQVEDSEVVSRISAMAEQAQTPVKKYIKELQKANAIQNVRNSVLVGKTIDFIVSKAKVTEVNPTEENDA